MTDVDEKAIAVTTAGVLVCARARRRCLRPPQGNRENKQKRRTQAQQSRHLVGVHTAEEETKSRVHTVGARDSCVVFTCRLVTEPEGSPR